jgi:hypothetical protein
VAAGPLAADHQAVAAQTRSPVDQAAGVAVAVFTHLSGVDDDLAR